MKKKTVQILSALIFFSLLTGNQAFARMDGSGSGGQGGMGSGPGAGTESGPSGGEMMDTRSDHLDYGSMPMITTGGLGSGDITMDITPVKYKNGRLEVKYSANTHSMSLGKYDLMELSTLEIDGKVYKPVKADRMRGHHAGGRIVFEVPEKPERFRIVIRDIPRVEERLFDWN